jgi:hypothetical protein
MGIASVLFYYANKPSDIETSKGCGYPTYGNTHFYTSTKISANENPFYFAIQNGGNSLMSLSPEDANSILEIAGGQYTQELYSINDSYLQFYSLKDDGTWQKEEL